MSWVVMFSPRSPGAMSKPLLRSSSNSSAWIRCTWRRFGRPDRSARCVAVLDLLAHMAVALDAEAREQADAERRRLAEVMAAAEADGDDAGHAREL